MGACAHLFNSKSADIKIGNCKILFEHGIERVISVTREPLLKEEGSVQLTSLC